MHSTLRATMALVVTISMPAFLASACSTTAPAPEPGDSAEDVPEAESQAAPPEARPTQANQTGLLHEPPSGNYRVERTAISDTCSPAQTSTASTNLGVVSRFRNGEAIASVPAVLGPQGAAIMRMDLVLAVGKKVESSQSLCEGATSKFRATVSAVEANSFTVRVERDYQGVEACAELRPNTPASSCSSVEELRFEVESSLCPARCAFQPRLDASGTLAGECNCGRQRNPK